MERVNLADAKARFSEMVDRAESGESIEIVRRGKPAARLLPPVPAKQPVDVDALRAAASKLPYQQESGAELIRKMRDSGY